MQRFELLGGKYQQGEQILPGVVQSFRAYEVSTGRPVFIHRVESKEAAAQAISSLLSAALIRSAAVRKMVVDVYENEPYRFVVTEPARQCVPLRDWLEREAGHPSEQVVNAPVAAVVPIARVSGEPATTLEPARTESVRTEPPATGEPEEIRESPDVEATEFARMFRAALAGKLEREKRDAQRNSVIGYGSTGEPAVEEEDEDLDEQDEDIDDEIEQADPIPFAAGTLPKAADAAPSPASEPELFSQLTKAEKGGRSNLVIFLIVLAVLVALAVMFVVVFVKR